LHRHQGKIEIGGRVVFDSASAVDLKPEQRALGIVFQSYAIWPHMSVAANVGFPLKVRGIPRAEAGKRIDRMLAMVGLAAMRDRPATDLSGGQQQRVALARALVHEPSLVLFDEPMSNLDAQLRDQMRIELKMLQERLNFTAVYVTHDQSEAFALARTVVVMNRGRVEAIGAPREVARQPSTPFVARFLGYNVVEGTISEVAAAGAPARITLAPAFAVSGVAAPGLAFGAPGVLCVRREHVRVEKSAAPSHRSPRPEGGRQFFSGVVRAISFQGLHQEYLLDISGVALRAIGAPFEVEEGDTVAIGIDRENCMILPSTPPASRQETTGAAG